jgi:hypothetical protein
MVSHDRHSFMHSIIPWSKKIREVFFFSVQLKLIMIYFLDNDGHTYIYFQIMMMGTLEAYS